MFKRVTNVARSAEEPYCQHADMHTRALNISCVVSLSLLPLFLHHHRRRRRHRCCHYCCCCCRLIPYCASSFCFYLRLIVGLIFIFNNFFGTFLLLLSLRCLHHRHSFLFSGNFESVWRERNAFYEICNKISIFLNYTSVPLCGYFYFAFWTTNLLHSHWNACSHTRIHTSLRQMNHNSRLCVSFKSVFCSLYCIALYVALHLNITTKRSVRENALRWERNNRRRVSIVRLQLRPFECVCHVTRVYSQINNVPLE